MRLRAGVSYNLRELILVWSILLPCWHIQNTPRLLAVTVHRCLNGRAPPYICRTIASQSPVLTLGGICVPPTVNCLQYLVTGSTLTAVGLFRLPAPQSGTLSRIPSGTRPSVRTVSDGCLKRTCSLDTSAFSALEVLTTTVLYKFTYLLTYLLQLCRVSVTMVFLSCLSVCPSAVVVWVMTIQCKQCLWSCLVESVESWM